MPYSRAGRAAEGVRRGKIGTRATAKPRRIRAQKISAERAMARVGMMQKKTARRARGRRKKVGEILSKRLSPRTVNVWVAIR